MHKEGLPPLQTKTMLRLSTLRIRLLPDAGLCDYPAVDILVNEGPQRIHELNQMPVCISIWKTAASPWGWKADITGKRILHAGGDATGRMVTSFMISKVINNPKIDIFENHSVIGILQENQECYGVRAWNLVTESEELFYADNTFLTLGGTSAIYKRTTNPHTTIGDGLALAFNAGCEIADMEFIQFHPSAIYTESEEAFLISEAVRGEGAYLIDQNGERFMPAIHELAELAPRDIVAQSIYRQMLKYDQEYVWLVPQTPRSSEVVKHRFPNIYEKCQELGIDMCDRIPVAPAAHYMVGGVRTDTHGQTNIKRLFICGELASSGIMGANRLASNSLIECLVFGKRAIEASRKNLKTSPTQVFKPIYHCNDNYAALYVHLKKEISRIMTDYAGIIRNAEKLKQGLNELESLEDNLPREINEYNTLICRNLITVARLIICSALYRQESRGGHFREDYPCSDASYLFHIVQQKEKDLRTLPVNTKKSLN